MASGLGAVTAVPVAPALDVLMVPVAGGGTPVPEEAGLLILNKRKKRK